MIGFKVRVVEANRARVEAVPVYAMSAEVPRKITLAVDATSDEIEPETVIRLANEPVPRTRPSLPTTTVNRSRAVNRDDMPRSVLVPVAVPVPTQVPAGRAGLGAAWPVEAPIRTAASTVPATAAWRAEMRLSIRRAKTFVRAPAPSSSARVRS